jgi:hypothetical protein
VRLGWGFYLGGAGMRGLWLFAGLALVVGCVPTSMTTGTPITASPRTGFQKEEYEPYAGEGTAAVVGQAFLKTKGGDVKYAAGNEVRLVPKTSYSTEWWQRVVLGNENLGSVDERAKVYTRVTIADGEGRFKFENLPPGSYYAFTIITWQVPSQYGLKETGGVAGGEYRVAEGQRLEVILQSVR